MYAVLKQGILQSVFIPLKTTLPETLTCLQFQNECYMHFIDWDLGESGKCKKTAKSKGIHIQKLNLGIGYTDPTRNLKKIQVFKLKQNYSEGFLKN